MTYSPATATRNGIDQRGGAVSVRAAPLEGALGVYCLNNRLGK
jgi:hypothetical protein